jgi:fatty-acyl-CoA synthase
MGFINRLVADAVYLRGVIRTLKVTRPIAKNPQRIFPHVIAEAAAKFGARPALISPRERFTYAELNARANRYARWALQQGIRKGDTLCVLMGGHPEYIALWIGITRVGGVVALLNTKLTGAALAHCINIVNSKHIIVAADLLESLVAAGEEIYATPTIWVHGASSANFQRIDDLVDACGDEELAPSDLPALSIEDRALFIYTSGTTGLPKAANLNHYRVMLIAHAFAGVMNIKPGDRMYDCLPLYHTAGGLAAVGALLVRGGCVVIRENFSVRQFWNDVLRWNCTCFQYIGELCRYLVNAEPHENERAHQLRIACGNGLRPEVWRAFKQRFRIPQILEFYASTEGNVSLFNLDGKEGAVGRIPWWLAHLFPVKIVRLDSERWDEIRDARGFCIECTTGEPGEVIGKIVKDPSMPGARFEGYAKTADTERKLLHDAFKKGDVWFRTGDLMIKDARGYFYFVDRIGDTYRWKGENVSTTEVERAFNRFDGVLEANVYGVTVHGHEGRAGMAAVVARQDLDLGALRTHLGRQLPPYALPVFLRIRRDLDVTTTFKQKKIELVGDGFDPKCSSDPIYFNDPQRSAFVPLDGEMHRRINAGEIRL